MKFGFLLGLALGNYFPSANVEYHSHQLETRDVVEDTVELGTKILSEKYSIDQKNILVTQSFKGIHGTLHVYAMPLLNDIPIVNQNFAIHLRNGKIWSVSSTYKPISDLVKNDAENVKSEEAIVIAEKELKCPRYKNPAKVYLQTSPTQLTLVHQFQLRDIEHEKWYQVAVDTSSGKIVEVIDFGQHATFNAIKYTNENVNKQGFEKIVNPEYTPSSPLGWLNDGTQTYKDTQGNNAQAKVWGVELDESTLPSTENDLFDSQFDPTQEPDTLQNVRAAVVNIFHDIFYQYGFTEAAGNFQKSNFGKGGDENDAITIRSFDTAKENDATFFSGPDGEKGMLMLYKWTKSVPARSAAFDNTLMAHELFHGVTNRMTGGARDSRCMKEDKQSRGLGEGWSDFFAAVITKTEKHTRNDDSVLGAYVSNDPKGVRIYPVSTDMTRNPMTYSNWPTQTSFHRKGVIWAAALYELYWNLVEKYGFGTNWYDNTQKKGNILALSLVFQGIRLQPCNPSVLQARDAIIASTDQEDKCDIWKAFAKRGLGVNATNEFQDDFSVPSECSGNPAPSATGNSSTPATTPSATGDNSTPSVTSVAITESVMPTMVVSVTSFSATRTRSRKPRPTQTPDSAIREPSTARTGTATPMETPIPVALVFPKSGGPESVLAIKKGQQTKISFRMSRLKKVCGTTQLCYYKLLHKATCQPSTGTDFIVTFPDAGQYFVYIESTSEGCSSADRNWNWLGYSVHVE